MKKLYTTLFLMLLTTVATMAQGSTTTLYSWESPDGTVAETGGTITQHNSLAISRINYVTSGYHTIHLCGKKQSLTAEDNSLNAVYFTITLDGDHTLKAGDEITITAMRNNDDGGRASIYFRYGNGTVVEDTNTWANLGQMHEMNFSGGSEAKARKSAGTEGVKDYALDPSTNTFIVPEAADGSTSLTLTRNESDCSLYITKIKVTQSASTAVHEAAASPEAHPSKAYNICGQQVSPNSRGLIIVGCKKIMRSLH